MLRNNGERLILAIILVFAILLINFPVRAKASSALSVNARAAAILEPSTGEMLYSKNADAPLPMASTTKIMTALVAIEREDLDREITVDSRAVGIEGSSAYLRGGERLTLSDLLYALMLQSANDAAAAIAYHFADSIEAFADLMNDKASRLGLKSTHFTNPHGLDDDGHFTTAEDLAKIAAAALKYPEFREIVSTKIKRVEKPGFSRVFVNHNKLLSRYDYCIGVKTGFTKKCGRCLVSAAERDGITLIAVTLDCPDDWREHDRMLDFGFNILERTVLVKKDTFLHSLPVIGGDADTAVLSPLSDIFLIKRKTDPAPKAELELPRYLTAPVQAGTVVGWIKITDSSGNVTRHPITVKETINETRKKGFFGLFK